MVSRSDPTHEGAEMFHEYTEPFLHVKARIGAPQMDDEDGGSGKAREFSLGDDFGEVTIKVNGVRIDVDGGGNVKVEGDGEWKRTPVDNPWARKCGR
jgi:hypothetical protein